jgi:uncharacterized protein (DUF2147 family)
MKHKINLIILFISLFFMQCVFAMATNSPLGYWKTIDDVTGKPKAIVQIWETPNHLLYGRILKIYPRPGYDQNELCSACEGAKHNQRIVGMVILTDLKQNQKDSNKWSSGQILDPKNGKTYHCNLEVIDGGMRLKVRGYIGVSLFGRTQTWLRAENARGE